MIIVFSAALSLAGWRLNRFFAETMRLRFELGAANLRLQAEITEREATEAALRQAQKLEAVGQLTGGISPDSNNLLTLAIGKQCPCSDVGRRQFAHRPSEPPSELRLAVRAISRGVCRRIDQRYRDRQG